MLAKLVKNLREMTGAGFLDCKKALEASNNEIEKAVIWLKEKGVAKAIKKSKAIAIEGIVQTFSNDKYVIIFELNTQTDFVANNKEFKNLSSKISNALLENEFNSIDEAKSIRIENKTIKDLIIDAISRIGEKIELRRAEKIYKDKNIIGAYTHVNNRVAAIVISEGGSENIIRNVAMHVASMNPEFLNEESIPLEKIQDIEKAIKNSSTLINKPKDIKEKIANGMLRKCFSELTLLNQEFVMEKITVFNYLKKNNAKAIKMIRYELGEAI